MITPNESLHQQPVSDGLSALERLAALYAGEIRAAIAYTPGSATILHLQRDRAAMIRLIVEVGIWSSGNATAKTVTDAANDTFTKLLSFTASDHTEMSIWSAPVTTGAGTKPAITITPTATTSANLPVPNVQPITLTLTVN